MGEGSINGYKGVKMSEEKFDIRKYLEGVRSMSDEVEELRYALKEAELEEEHGVIDGYKERLSERILELTHYRKRVLLLIESISDALLRTLLIARYINCKTWEELAEDIGYSDKWVRTSLHRRALAAAERVKLREEAKCIVKCGGGNPSQGCCLPPAQ